MGKLHGLITLLLLSFPIFLYGQLSDNVVLDYTTFCSIEKGKKTIERHYLIQVNNEQGEWITDIKIPFQKGNKINSLKAEIRDNAGNLIRKLKKSEIIETSYISDISLYEDDYVKKFSLKHNKYPYQIYYSYSIEYAEFFWIESWTPVLDTTTPTAKASLFIKSSIEYPVKISQQNITDFEGDTLNGFVTYKWSANYLTPVKDEVYAPNIRDLVPMVHIVPVRFKFGVEGSHLSWATYGNWMEKLSDGLNKLPVSEQGKIHHLIKGIEDPKEIVRILYNYMQDNTRYINVAIDIGGLKPYPAEYVALNKYGDCKALTNYMKAILEIAKIPSFCVDVYADINPGKIKQEYPSQQFNHVILMVPLKNDTIWLENTSNTLPVGYVNSYIQNRKGLLINGNNSRIIDIPSFNLDEVKESRSITYNLDEQLNCSLEVKSILRGRQFEFYNTIKSQYRSNQQRQILENNLPFKNFEIIDWEIQQADRNIAELSLAANIKLKNNVSIYDLDLIIRPHNLMLPDFQSPEKRKQPVRINYPIHKVDNMSFNIPKGVRFKKHSEEIIRKTPFGTYSIEIAKNDNEVNITRSFILNSGEYQLNQYPEFYEFIKSVKDAEAKNYINLLLIEDQ